MQKRGGGVYLWDSTVHCMYTLYRQMKLLLRHYGIDTTEIPEEHMAQSGPPPPPHRRASEGLGVGIDMEAPPPASLSLSRHSWPSVGGSEQPGANRGQVGGVFVGSSRGQGFAAAINPLQVCTFRSSTMSCVICLSLRGDLHTIITIYC